MSKKTLLKSKVQATLIHLAISAAIFLPLLYLILFHWYPGPMFFTDGGWQGVKIMLLVDMVLGPSLTFLIFNPQKTRLAIGVDFSFIALVQAVALIYGVYSVERTSVMTVAFNDGIFNPVGKNHYKDQEIAEGGWDKFGGSPQYWVFVRQPKGEEGAGVFAAAMINSTPIEALFFLYVPLAEHKEDVRKHALDMPKLAAVDANLKEKYERFAQQHRDSAKQLSYYRLTGFYGSAIVALDEQLQYVGFINHEVPQLPAAQQAVGS